MKKYDKRFASRLTKIASRIVTKIAFTTDTPELTKMIVRSVAESWKTIDEQELKDRNTVEDAFSKMFNIHSELTKSETDENTNQRVKTQIEDLTKSVNLLKKKRLPLQKRKDDVAKSKKIVYNKKIKKIEDKIQRLKAKLTKPGKMQSTEIDKGIEMLDKSIRMFINKLENIGWSEKNIKKMVHQGMFNSGYGYKEITKWFKNN